jgi:hypothetical protein
VRQREPRGRLETRNITTYLAGGGGVVETNQRREQTI